MTGIARYLLVPMALAWAGSASAQTWQVASIGGESPDRTAYVVDSSTVARSGDIVDFRTQSIYENYLGGRDFNLSDIKRRGNCRTMSSQIMADSYFADGKLLSTNEKPGEMSAAREGSAIWGVLQTVCGKRDYATQPISDPFNTIRSFFKTNP